ncbi:hypothetical protein ABZW10_01965 [Kitasatospora sp. NPDC004723]|uniref:hypothetical protein n=1 Tax=Kitasatospora sp. NPDC004723 TaxID=3154288 RepID=UPI0033B48C95
MDSTDTTVTASRPARFPDRSSPDGSAPASLGRTAVRFLPGVAAYAVLVAALLASDTPVNDIARYTFYAFWGVLLPGTLVFRSLRRRPYTLLEDLAFGAVTGLVLELLAWAVLVGLGLQSVATFWPLVVVLPFALVPGLRRHWRPRGYRAFSPGRSWALAGTVALTVLYYYEANLARFSVLPTDDSSRIYGDLPYMLSLAGSATHDMPPTFPQAAGEPLHYHWFTFAHMAMTSLVGHVDLPMVGMRLMVPALSALTVLIIAVVAQRLSGKAWAGPVAALLFFAVGEFTATYPNNVSSWTFGFPPIRLMSWGSLSLTYSQPLLVALAGAVGALIGRKALPGGPEKDEDDEQGVPAFGRGAFVLVAGFALASSAAKASTLPVTLAGLALAGLVMLVTGRRIPWTVVGLGAILAGAQLFATAVIFDFESYGLEVAAFGNVQQYWADTPQARGTAAQAAVVVATLAAFVITHQVRLAGALPLFRHRRLNLEPAQWFLLGGAVAGPAAYLAVNGFNSSYFTIASAPFGALLAAWGYCEAAERAALSVRARFLLAGGVLVLAAGLTWGIYRHARDWAELVAKAAGAYDVPKSYAALLPVLGGTVVFAAAAAVGALVWWGAGRFWPRLRGRGGIVLLTATLTVGLPGTALDVLQSREYVWEGSWILPQSQVSAARWVRNHSDPADVIATNSHCWETENYTTTDRCGNYRSQWLSAYSERSVLVEGWAYAPRMVAQSGGGVVSGQPFWDQELFQRNENAIYQPTAELLDSLRREYRVRYLVVDRKAGAESPLLGTLTTKVYDNGRTVVYELA